MRAVKVLIVEDELIIAESISDLLEEIGYEVTDIVKNAEKALESVRKNQPDIAILDIQLQGDKTGIWLGEQLRKKHQLPFIYLTSHGDKQTVEEAVSTLPYGYVIKPIEKQALFATLESAIARYGSEMHKKGEANSPVTEDHFRKGAFTVKDALFIKDEYLYIKIPFQDLLYFKASGNYIEIHTADKKLLLKHSLKDIANTLESQAFYQTQRSFIVNIEKIDSIGSNMVIVNGHEIPLSKTSREDLIHKMQMQ